MEKYLPKAQVITKLLFFFHIIDYHLKSDITWVNTRQCFSDDFIYWERGENDPLAGCAALGNNICRRLFVIVENKSFKSQWGDFTLFLWNHF